MNAHALMLPLLIEFVNCFTRPGFAHFQTFISAHAALFGLQHCVTEVMRLTQVHKLMHWTTPYAFLKKGRWSGAKVSQTLLDLITRQLHLPSEIIIALDDTLVKKWGRNFFGLGYYPDPTDKNPGASKRRVLGHCWVVMALLWENAGRWFAFPLAALLFVPEKVCPKGWEFMTKIELAALMLKRLRWPAQRLVLVVDNLYAKAKLAGLELEDKKVVLISRLRSNAALYEPPKRKKGPGRPPKRGKKVSPKQLWLRRSQRQTLKVHIYQKTVTIEAFVGVLVPSTTLGDKPVLVIVFPQRSGKKMNVFFCTDTARDPERVLEIYSARWKIEELFREVKTSGGFGDYRQRSFTAIKRHANLCLVAYSFLRLLSLCIPRGEEIEAEPWWDPSGPPSVSRLRRAFYKALRISPCFHSDTKPQKIAPLKEAA